MRCSKWAAKRPSAQSLASVRMDGTIVIIGAVSGVGGAILPRQLITGSTRVQGVYVGSRSMHEDLARFVELAGIVPVVDRTFALAEAPEAFNYFLAGKHFGKVAHCLQLIGKFQNIMKRD